MSNPRYTFYFRCQNRLPFEQGCLGTWNQKRSIQNPCPTSQKEKRGWRLCSKTLHFGHLRSSRLLQGAQDCQCWCHRVNKSSNKRTIYYHVLFCLCTICIWCLFRCRVNYRIACVWNQLWISSDVSRRTWLRHTWQKWLTLWVGFFIGGALFYVSILGSRPLWRSFGEDWPTVENDAWWRC